MWLQNGNTFQTRDPGSDLAKLPPHVYTIQVTMMGTYLEKQQDQFEFPYKIYGNSDFPKRVAHNYKHTTGNLGVLLTGLKGTGKTVEAEQICNMLGLPVILVTAQWDGLVPFLNRIPEDIVVFIDEYEKLFERSNALLSLMDGALRTRNRRVFLLTTNETYITPAMLNRPSRIFYVKRFGNLEGDMIAEIVNDMLEDSVARMEAIKFLASLEIITVDIVKAVCAEMLRFNELPNAFKALMNVEQRFLPRKMVHHQVGDKKILISSNALLDPSDPFNSEYSANVEEDYAGCTLSIADGNGNGHYTEYGRIKASDKNAGTVTTEQGVFHISEVHTHPSLKQYMAMTV